MSRILVLCTANVCRSIYAAALLQAGLARAGIQVESAGLASFDRPACSLVQQRAALAGLVLPEGDSRQVRLDDLAGAELVLVMTTVQRTAIARMLPDARHRTMTLIEAALVSTALSAEGVSSPSLAEFTGQLERHRSTVPLPVERDIRRILGVFPLKGGRVRAAITIEDGHVQPGRKDHEHSLDLVQSSVEQLLAAWAGQPWLATPSPKAGAQE